MLTIFHLSDLHVHSSQHNEDQLTTLINRFDTFKKYIYDPFKTESNKKLIIISGDITDDGKPSQISNFMKLIHRFNLEHNIILVPGNHDYIKFGTQFSIEDDEVLTKARKFYDIQMHYINNLIDNGDMSADIYDVDEFYKDVFIFWKKKTGITKHLITLEIKSEQVVIFVIDSNPHDIYNSNFARGTIGPKQLKYFKQLAQTKYSDWFKVVTFHHHPFYHDDLLKLTDATKAVKYLNQYADLVLVGHRHKSGSYKSKYFFATNVSKTKNEIVPINVFTFKNKKLDSVCTYGI